MIVPNALSGLSDLTSQVKQSTTSAIKNTTVGKVAAIAQAVPPTPTGAMRKILAHYDMTDVTPSEFSKLIQQLSDKGAISKQDVQELSSIRVDLENADWPQRVGEPVGFLSREDCQGPSCCRPVAQFRGGQGQHRSACRAVELGAEVRLRGQRGSSCGVTRRRSSVARFPEPVSGELEIETLGKQPERC